MNDKNAKDECRNLRLDIANLIGFFECQLGKKSGPFPLAEADSLRILRRGLISTLSFLSGFEASEIEKSLQDCRPAAAADAEEVR